MKQRLATAFALGTLVLGFALSVYADHRETRMIARLHGLNEVPPTNSRATADLNATLSADEQTITFTLSYRNLSAVPSAAHIHFGPTKVNGGAMVFFCGGGGMAACPPATSGTVTGSINKNHIVGPAGQGIPAAPAGQFADVVRAIRTGNAYANIHNTNFTGGEIRGQIVALGQIFGDND